MAGELPDVAVDRLRGVDATRRVFRLPFRSTTWLVIILGCHSGLLIYSASIHSPTFDEVAHLPAGVSCWQRGRLGLYPVNPPLIRCLAALPVCWLEPQTDWTADVALPGVRPEFDVGRDFVRVNGRHVELYFELARLMLIPVSVWGGWACYQWSTALFGRRSGLWAASLWSFSPTVLASASQITPDAGAAATGVLAGYAFWRWGAAPTWRRAVVAGVLLGIALLCKMTLLVLLGIWPALWLLRCRVAPPVGRPVWSSLQLLCAMCLALGVLNTGYGFDGTGSPLGGHHFCSRMLGGGDPETPGGVPGNRFRDTWLGQVPMPFPTEYLVGLDLQKRDFERGMWSYLAGEHRFGGWWYFYLYALAVKLPLATWLLAGLAGVVWVGQSQRDRWAAWNLFVPPLVILFLVSWHFSISRYLRYLLPAFPYVFVGISRVAGPWESRHRERWPLGWRPLASWALAGSITSSLLVFPHSLSYFNLLAGGPLHGHAHLIDASIDWGQDLKLLRDWLATRRLPQPIFLAVHSALDPRWLGIEYQDIPAADGRGAPQRVLGDDGPSASRTNRCGRVSSGCARPAGWYALSVHRLRDRHGCFDDFRQRKPFARIGYSIYIYHIAGGVADRGEPAGSAGGLRGDDAT